MSFEKSKHLAKLLLDKFLAMPYFRNYSATSGLVHNIHNHETAVEDILIHHTFQKHTPPNKYTKATIAEWIAHPTRAHVVPEYSYIPQPNGTHNSPDFLIKLNHGVVLSLECKSSSNSTYPMYNSGGIKPNYIYLFCSEKTNKSTFFLGQDIQTTEQQQIIQELESKIDALVATYNTTLNVLDTHQRGVAFYSRSMICQKGKHTNYFDHPERHQCEQNVYQYVDNLIETTRPQSPELYAIQVDINREDGLQLRLG